MQKIFVFLSFIICTTVLSGCDKVSNLAESNLNASPSATLASTITTAAPSNSSTNRASSSNPSSNERNVGSNKTDNNANGEYIVPFQNNQDGKRDIKIAVVYFSGTGNTRAIAEMIAQETRADIYEIIPNEAYTSDDLNYNDSNCRANKEQGDETSRPVIKNDLSATTKYDVVYLGYPIWWGVMPRIIQTYLEKYDLSKAKIYVFCTSGSSRIERSMSDLREFYPSLNIIDGKRLNNASEKDIQNFTNQ